MENSTITFDTYEQFKEFALERDYGKQMRYGDTETWYTDGAKAIVRLADGHKYFTASVPVVVRFFEVKSYVAPVQ